MRFEVGLNKNQGVTLIELIVSVVIVGLIAAISSPHWLEAVDRSKQRRTMTDMRAIGMACEEYSLDNHFYPVSTTQSLVSTIAPRLVPIYIKSLPAKDSWGWNIQYGTTVGGSSYTVRSFGKDGAKNGGLGPTTNPNCDIIFRNGQFTSYPADLPR